MRSNSELVRSIESFFGVVAELFHTVFGVLLMNYLLFLAVILVIGLFYDHYQRQRLKADIEKLSESLRRVSRGEGLSAPKPEDIKSQVESAIHQMNGS